MKRLVLSLVYAAGTALLAGCASDKKSDICHEIADAGTGTWTDPVSCLMWQDPLFVDVRDWASAVASCNSLELAGYKDWRLPTIDELRSLARGCAATTTGGACGVTDDCLETACSSDVCAGCAEMGGPAAGGCYRLSALTGDCMTSWTSSVVPDVPDDVWTVGFGGCHVLHYPKARSDINTRCVRR